MEKPFKYQFPIKHITLNELPSELYPQPMKRVNYNIKELLAMRREQVQSNSYSCDASDNTIKERNEKNNNEDVLSQYATKKPTKLQKKQETPINHKKRSSISAHIKSKTDQLYKMQTEFSQETRDLIFKGTSIAINLYDEQTIVPLVNPEGTKRNSDKFLPVSLNDTTIKFLNQTQTFIKSRENVRDKLRSRLFSYYDGALKNPNQGKNEYLLQQASRYREYETPKIVPKQKIDIVEPKTRSNQKTKVISRRTQSTQKHYTEVPRNHYRTQSVTDNETLIKARTLKTDQHHRLISKLTAKTSTLIQQWQQFQITEDEVKIGKTFKEQQMKILTQNNSLTDETQVRLRGELGQLLKIIQKTDNS